MENNRWREIERIFYETLELPEPQRADFLAQACHGDATLQREVNSLLAAHQEAHGFLASANAPLSAKQVLQRSTTNGATQRIGPYQLLHELAQGGMGTVWLAERADEQYQQKVAIKLLKTGANNPDIAHRLRHERQILANLNHPNIARLLDGGTTESGQPYLVMEYIEGVPIDAYCREQQLTLRARLQLFRQVCSAVQYAHQHLIIHRDLKPANILVTADGTPKLLDFGIAKLLQPDPSQAYQTQTGQTPMTPAYASPEQVRSEPLTTTSDVYSLGVVLYELLTGRSPYQLKANTFNEMMRAICEQEPTRPSLVTKSEVGSQKSEGKRKFAFLPTTDFRFPTTLLKGDLDSIVLMALRKEPTARYASVEQFSTDIQRYLDGLPTLARKGTLAYRTVKYMRRHKVPVAAAALILLSLLSGIGATSRQAQIARAEQAKAEAERIRAERAFAVADEQRHRAEQALAEVKAERTRAENALTNAEQRRQQAEAARNEANQQRAAAETQRLAAEAERNVAQIQRKLADEQRQRAETQELSNRQLLYTSRMGLAQQAWENGNIGRMRELLDFYLPQTGEPDFRAFEWYYLWRLCHQEIKTFTHAGSVNGLAYSPNGKVLVTLTTTQPPPTGRSEITFRDATTWQTIFAKQLPGISVASGAVAIARDADKVVVGTDSLRVFSFSDYKERLHIAGLQGMRSLDITASGKLIAAGFLSGKIQLFDADSGKVIRTFEGHQQQVNTVRFSLDEQTLVSGSFDQTVRLWNVSTGKEMKTLRHGSQVPNSAVFTPDGRFVVVACSNMLRVWEVSTGHEVAERPIGPDTPVVAISSDGKTVATGDAQPLIRLWDTQTWQETAAIKGHGNLIQALAFTPDGTQLASGSIDQTARIWGLAQSEKEVRTLADPSTGIVKAVFTPDGQKLISTSVNIAKITIWDAASEQKLQQWPGHTHPPDASGFGAMLAVSPNGELFATGGVDRLVKIWEAASGKEIRTLRGLTYAPNSLSFSPDGKTLAAGDANQAKLWEVASGREVLNVKIPDTLVNAVSFLPDHKTLVTGSSNGAIQFWDLATGRELKNIPGGNQAVFPIAITSDGKYLAAGFANSNIVIWDVASSQQKFVLKGHSAIVRDVKFSPDGKRLISAGDGTIKLWDVQTGQEILTLKEPGLRFLYATFSPDGKQILSPYGRGARIWLAAHEADVEANKH